MNLSKRPILALGLPLAAMFCLIAPRSPEQPLDLLAPLEPPPAERIALLEELVDWVGDDGDSDDLLLAEPLAEMVRTRATSFDLFLTYPAADLEADHLAELPFGQLIRRAGDRFGLDPLLIAAIVEAESSFNPLAVSGRGATGLMQVMPGNVPEGRRELLTDPKVNLEAGARYLRGLLRLYEGDLELALAAYNAGPGNVQRFGGVPPFRETQRYVDKVLGIYINHHRQRWRSTGEGEMLARAEPAARLLHGFVG